MANDISGINSSKPQQATTQRTASQNGQTQQTTATQATQSSDTADKVSLTNTAEKLKALEKQLSQEAPVNEQKVADVRAALDSGNYQVDADKIAEKMIDFESHFDE